MLGISVARVTLESWEPGPEPLIPVPIKRVPAKTAAASNSSSERSACGV